MMTKFERLLVVRILVGLTVAAGVSACSSDGSKCCAVQPGTGGVAASGGSGGASGPDASHDASLLGQSYACGSGAAPAADAAPPLECVVGQSYCKVQLLDKVAGSSPIYYCLTVTEDGGLGACASTPTCACLCAQGNGVRCETECACSDTGGFAVITCHQV